MFCKHEWEVLVNETTESQMEQTLRLTGECPMPNNSYELAEMTKRKNICTLACKKCGKLKHYVEVV